MHMSAYREFAYEAKTEIVDVRNLRHLHPHLHLNYELPTSCNENIY